METVLQCITAVFLSLGEAGGPDHLRAAQTVLESLVTSGIVTDPAARARLMALANPGLRNPSGERMLLQRAGGPQQRQPQQQTAPGVAKDQVSPAPLSRDW